MRRVAPLLGGIAVVGIVLPFFIGLGPWKTLYLLPLFGALGAVALVGSRRAAVVERGWSGAGGSPVVAPASVGAGPRPRPRPPAARVAAALSRVEAREMATSPWFGAGLGFLAMGYLTLAVAYADDTHWAEVVDLAPWLAHPLVGMVVLAAHRAITRAQRDGTDELFDTCPVAPTTRTWGVLGASWVPVLSLIVFAAVYGLTVAVRSHLYGSPGPDAVPQLLAAFLLGLGGVVLGVALGRWVRFALAPVVAVVAVGFFSMRIVTLGDPGWNPLQQLSTFPPVSSNGGRLFRDPPVWSHLGWLVALTAVVLVVALARHRRDRTVAVAGLAACLLVAVTGVTATRPMSGSSAARIADRVARPAAHQDCRTAGSIQVCAYTGSAELLGRVIDEIRPVAAMLPDSVAPVTLLQRYEGTIDDLPPEVRRRLPDGVPAAPTGEIPLGFSVARDELRVPRLRIGLHALGLPTQPGPDLRPTVIAGQAGGVVALWLATRGLEPATIRNLTSGISARDLGNREPDTFDRGYAWPAGCATAPVVWSAQDLRAARALAALPEPTVRSVVHQGWERWLDPTTATDELLAAAGLPPAGPFDRIQTRRVDPC